MAASDFCGFLSNICGKLWFFRLKNLQSFALWWCVIFPVVTLPNLHHTAIICSGAGSYKTWLGLERREVSAPFFRNQTKMSDKRWWNTFPVQQPWNLHHCTAHYHIPFWRQFLQNITRTERQEVSAPFCRSQTEMSTKRWWFLGFHPSPATAEFAPLHTSIFWSGKSSYKTWPRLAGQGVFASLCRSEIKILTKWGGDFILSIQVQ